MSNMIAPNLGARLEVGDPVEERLGIPLVLFPELLQIRPNLIVPWCQEMLVSVNVPTKVSSKIRSISCVYHAFFLWEVSFGVSNHVVPPSCRVS